MANLPLAAAWPDVYRLETSDPVQAGPDGILNVPPTQLGNRTEYLKIRADMVDAAKGGFASLAARLSSIEGGRGLVAQGVAVLKNKFVVTGFVLTKAVEVRVLHLSVTGVVGAGTSRAFMDGALFALGDDDYHVAVPTNETNASKTYYAYLRRSFGRVEIGSVVPDDALLLYRLTIPAMSLQGLEDVVLTDQRVVQQVNSWLASVEPSVTVNLPSPVPDTNYEVVLEVESASGRAAVGVLSVADKATNAFKIRMSGSADNVRVRWAVMRVA